jgi:hypothetical protein
MMKMPCCYTALWRNQYYRARSIVKHFHRCAAQHFLPLGSTVLAQDDRLGLYLSRDL